MMSKELIRFEGAHAAGGQRLLAGTSHQGAMALGTCARDIEGERRRPPCAPSLSLNFPIVGGKPDGESRPDWLKGPREMDASRSPTPLRTVEKIHVRVGVRSRRNPRVRAGA